MMSALAFTYPAILFGLIALPIIWWLLRLTPPRPQTEVFPPLKILATVLKREETPSKSPWWLTLLRMLLAAAVIFAIADPVMNPRANSLNAAGPLVLVVDNGWATAADWERRVQTANLLIDDAESADDELFGPGTRGERGGEDADGGRMAKHLTHGCLLPSVGLRLCAPLSARLSTGRRNSPPIGRRRT